MRKFANSFLTISGDIVGEFNPQLLREIQGRLRARNLFLTVGTSLLAQGVFLLARFQELNFEPGICRQVKEIKLAGRTCWQMGDSYALVDWHDWWSSTFAAGNWFLLIGALAIGSFLLISDLAKEERRGTLTFLSLSPRPASTILMGKILGVPILLYLGLALTFPLHYFLAFKAQIPLTWFLMSNLLVVLCCFFFYSLALLSGFLLHWLNGFQAWLYASLLILFHRIVIDRLPSGSPTWMYAFSPSSLFIHSKTTPIVPSQYLSSNAGPDKYEIFSCFNYPIGAAGISMSLIIGLNLLLWTFWLWKSLQRRYQNKNSTPITKIQSYGASICFTLCYLGFAIFDKQSLDELPYYVMLLYVPWFLLLIVLLLPQYQSLLDWSRSNSRTKKTSNISDLLIAEDSPIWGAIIVNLIIVNLPLIVKLVIHDQVISSISLVMTGLLLLMITLVNQIYFVEPTTHKAWRGLTLFGPSLIPIVLFAIMGIETEGNFAWLLLLTPISSVVEEHVPSSFFYLVCLLYTCVAGLLILRLNRKLRIDGESATSQLFREDTLTRR